MATRTNTTPGPCLAVTGRERPSRRDVFAALGATMLTGIATAGFARPDGMPTGTAPKSTSDDALLAACVGFDHAHDAYIDSNAMRVWDQTRLDAVADEWYGAIDRILAAPPPQTNIGRAALARAARIVLVERVAFGIDDTFRESATKEEHLLLAALTGLAEEQA